MTFQEIEILKKTFLFKSMDGEALLKCCELAEISVFSDGDTVISGSVALGVILSGAVKITSKVAKTPLRVIPSGGIYGAAAIFGGEPITEVTAVGETVLCLFGRDAVEKIISSDPDFALSYVRFLSERVRYLNRKIEVFTAGSAAEKLAFYLSEITEDGADSVTTHLGELAGALDLGRASLYRAIDTLTDQGIISHEGRTLRILDKEKLNSLV